MCVYIYILVGVGEAGLKTLSEIRLSAILRIK